jgi:hypothetical protein
MGAGITLKVVRLFVGVLVGLVPSSSPPHAPHLKTSVLLLLDLLPGALSLGGKAVLCWVGEEENRNKQISI